MARKFIDLDEAAKMVGVTPDTLNEMRERREVHGYRDGGAWKFKQEDLERVIADRAAVEEEGEFAELNEDPDSILFSEVELGQSDAGTSSTIIGGKTGKGKRPNPAESDIQLASPKDEELQLDQPKHDSDLDLDAAITSEAGGSDVLAGGSGVSPMFDELDTLDLEMPSAADSGIVSGGSGAGSKAGSGLSGLGLAPDSGMMTSSAPPPPKTKGGSSLLAGDDELALGEAPADSKAGGSHIDLTDATDDELVLGGSSHGDVSRTGDSGISLLDPADSGLSLESSPLEMGGSAVESLELGEDELEIDQPAAKRGAAAAAGTDDDFLLTPLDEAAGDDSDSGSQVIALEEGEVEFEEAGLDAGGFDADSGMVAAGAPGGLLEDDLGAATELGAAALAPAATAAPAAAGAPTTAAMMVPDMTFSGWNVASLVMCALLLMLSGMFMFDMMRNMWSWNAPYAVNSSLMDMVLSWFEK